MLLQGLEDELRAVVAPGERRRDLDAVAIRLLTPAPNAIEYVVRGDYQNAPSLYRFSRSYQVIRDFFELRCPLCNRGGVGEGEPGDCMPGGRPRSRMYLESEVLLTWSAAEQEDVCPKCRITKSELIEEDLMKGYSSVHLVVGQRAGKTTTAAYIGCYIEHRLLVTGHLHGGLWRYFGMEPGDLFENTFLAASDVMSKGTIWSKYTGYRRSAPWFQNYVAWVKEQEQRQARFGMKAWEYKESAKEINNEHPDVRLLINSLNSNSNTQAGRGRIYAVADELARMKQTESAMGAKEVYETLMASLRTVKSRVALRGLPSWMGTMASITSPIRKDDEAMRLLKKAPSIPSMYAAHYATWDFNPYEPRANFDEDFKRDPVVARRNFGADPVGAEHPFIADPASWAARALDRSLTPTVEFEPYEPPPARGHKYTAMRIAHARMVQDYRPRFVAFDAGKNFDAFTGAGGYGDVVVGKDGDERKITVVEWVMRCVPAEGVEVWFDMVVDIIDDWLPYVPYIGRIELDHWQSTALTQRLRNLGGGIECEEVFTPPDDFTRWRTDCFQGYFRMPWPAPSDYDPQKPLFDWLPPPIDLSPVGAGVYELTSLERNPETGKISNPNKGRERGANSDDTAQVLVRLHNLVQRFGFTERFYDNSVRARGQRAREGATWSPTLFKAAAGGHGGRKW